MVDSFEFEGFLHFGFSSSGLVFMVVFSFFFLHLTLNVFLAYDKWEGPPPTVHNPNGTFFVAALSYTPLFSHIRIHLVLVLTINSK